MISLIQFEIVFQYTHEDPGVKRRLTVLAHDADGATSHALDFLDRPEDVRFRRVTLHPEPQKTDNPNGEE